MRPRERDEAERLRQLLGRHRRVTSLRRAGRVVLHVEGEGRVELDDGLLVEAASLFDTGDPCGPGTADGGGLDPAFTVTADGHDKERVIVAQWLRFNADKVRVLEAGDAEGVGLAMRADRIPRLQELCGTLRSLPGPA